MHRSHPRRRALAADDHRFRRARRVPRFPLPAGAGIPFLLRTLALGASLLAFAFARRHTRSVLRMGRILLMVVGITQVSGLWNLMIQRMQTWIAGYELPL